MEQKKIAAADQSEPRELTSWKEIAQYLGVNVRTAQKWESERRLPVRRVSGPRSRVSAETTALDAWKDSVSQPATQEDRCYRWPLAATVTAEVRFVGGNLKPDDIGLLCEYLNLVKRAID